MIVRHALAAIITACFLVVGSEAMAQQGSSEKGLVFASANDAELNAAIGAARDALPTFWSQFDNPRPGEGPFLLKVALPTRDDSLEHIWIFVEGRKGAKITGKLSNKPFNIKGLSEGSKVTVTAKQVTDWTYYRGEVAYGHFTTRVLIKQMTPEQRAVVLSGLSATPIEVEKP